MALNSIGETPFDLLNKVDDSFYSCGIVNLSRFVLNENKISLLSKGLGFCPTPGAPDIGNISNDFNDCRRNVRLHLFFSSWWQQSVPTVNCDQPFQDRSFKIRSTFNPIGTYQLESVLSLIKKRSSGPELIGGTLDIHTT